MIGDVAKKSWIGCPENYDTHDFGKWNPFKALSTSIQSSYSMIVKSGQLSYKTITASDVFEVDAFALDKTCRSALDPRTLYLRPSNSGLGFETC